VLTADHGLRPPLINLYRFTTVDVSGVTLTNAQFWAIHSLMCQSLTGVPTKGHENPSRKGRKQQEQAGVLIIGLDSSLEIVNQISLKDCTF
jgi:hypothetical protein